MKVIQQLKERLAKMDATLDVGDGYVLNCDAPSGYVWRANGCCAIAIQCATNSQSWYAKAIREEMNDRLKMGLEKITDPLEIARHRHELGDDTWGALDSAPARIDWPNAQAHPTAARATVDGTKHL